PRFLVRRPDASDFDWGQRDGRLPGRARANAGVEPRPEAGRIAPRDPAHRRGLERDRVDHASYRGRPSTAGPDPGHRGVVVSSDARLPTPELPEGDEAPAPVRRRG